MLRERTVAAIPVGHPLARLQRVSLRRMAAEPLVLFPRDQAPGFHDLLTGRLAATRHVTPRGPVRAGDADDHRPGGGRDRASPRSRLGRRGLGLEGVTYRPLVGAPATELLAVTRAGDDSPLVGAFVSEARG